MSGLGSPRRKASCSVTWVEAALPPRTSGARGGRGAEPPGGDSTCVLFSRFRQALRKSDECPYGRALRAFRRLGPVAVEPERPGDVEMGPFGPVLDRGVEERGRLDGSALAARAVADVRDLAFDLLAVFVGQRHRPHAVACRGGRLAHE